MVRFLPAALLLALAALPVPRLAAQANAERVATGRDSRSHDYDLVHQRIELRDFDWDSASFRGQVELTVRALRPGFDALVLDAGPRLVVDSVRGLRRTTPVPRAGERASPGGQPPRGPAVRWEHRGDSLVLALGRGVAMGDTVRVVIDYHGRAEGGHGLRFFPADSLWPARPRQLWSQGQAEENHHWFPTYDFPNDPMTWELIATVPRELTLVSNGRLLRDRVNRDGTRTVHWHQDRPAVTYLVSLVVAPLVQFTDAWRGVRLDYNVYPSLADSARVRAAFGLTPDIMEAFSALTGVRYPWSRYAQTTVSEHFGGMENVTAATLADWIPDERALLDRPWYRHILIAHELAHQWFGDYVTTANWANMWLNEGFAEFLPGRYWALRQGPHAGEEYFLDEYHAYLAKDRERRMPLASLGSNNIYPKGALVLEMLRQELGDERFWAGVRRYLEAQRGQGATSDDLRQAFLQATGQNLDWFWAQWVYRAGHPEFAVTATWDSAQATVRLTVRQLQRDSLPADSAGLRFEVPEAFRGEVRVRVGTAAGERAVAARIDAREQVLEVPGVASAPAYVVFDADNRMLKTLRFEQPTAWLASQLHVEPVLWNRAWVIGELALRRDDVEAVGALARALGEADHFSTRVAAAGALAGQAAPTARMALLTALADTSAQVRGAAAAALGQGQPGDSAVIAALGRRWREDPSYEVRAAVVGALALADSAGATALLREALATPSYLDVIQGAALAATHRRGDTALAGPVDALVGRVRLAPEVLLGLAARGSGDARDRLFARALSPVAGLRQRALRAFRNLPPADRHAVLELLLVRTEDPTIQADLRAALGSTGR